MRKAMRDLGILLLALGIIGVFLSFSSTSALGGNYISPMLVEKTVGEFQGSGDRITETFDIDSDWWRIEWEVRPQDKPFYFSVGVFREGETEPFKEIKRTHGEEDSFYISDDNFFSDDFFLCISTFDVERWKIKVVEISED